MPLKKQRELKSKISIQAKTVIERLLWNKDYTEIITNTYNEVDGELFLIEGEAETFTFYPDMALDKSLLKQAHEFLKTTDKLKDAIDC